MQNNIFQRAYATEFYSQNAMFFLLILGLAFGFMRGNEHMALAEFIIALPICTLIPIAVWTFYTIKIVTFNTRTSHLPEMSFAFDLMLTPRRQRLPPLLLVSVNQFMPAIAYGFFLIVTGIKNQAWIATSILSGSLIIFVCAITVFLHRAIRHPHLQMEVSEFKTWLDSKSEKNHTRIFTEWLIRTHPGMAFFTKVAGCILLFAVCQLYKYDVYDSRLLAMAGLVAFCAMIAIVYQYVLFESSRFDILRNLPFPLTKRVTQFILCMAAFCIPDIVTLSWCYPEYLSLSHFAQILIFGFSLLLAGYCYLLGKSIAFEKLTTTLFFFGMALFLLILLKVPTLILSGAAIVYVLLSFRRNFYGFEVIIEKNQ